MSSHIQVVKICVHCGNDFIAKTTVTKFCSKVCNSRYYKVEIRKEKIAKSDLNTVVDRNHMTSAGINKDYLSVNDVCTMLSMSKPTIYRMIKSGRLRATNLSSRSTRVLREDLNQLFVEQNLIDHDFNLNDSKWETTYTQTYAEDVWYSIPEVMTLFNKNRTAIYTAFARANVPKKKIGKEVYFEQHTVMKLLRESQKPKQSPLSKVRFKNQKAAMQKIEPSQCYSIDECVAMFGKERSLLYGIFNRRLIPKIRVGQRIMLSKRAIDKLYKSFLRDGVIK